jgi:DNA-binding transcriptional ArsR family regulator
MNSIGNIQNFEDEVNLLHAKLCQGLADPKRILILYCLSEGALQVNELVETLKMPQPTVSHHLKILRNRGMVKVERIGTSACYSLADQRVIQALDLLREMLADQVAQQTAILEHVQ